MRCQAFIKQALIAVCLAVIPGMVALPLQAADQATEKATTTPSQKKAKAKDQEHAQLAPEHQAAPAPEPARPSVEGGSIQGGDETTGSVKDCVNKIPKDATPGQRMLAENSCQHSRDN